MEYGIDSDGGIQGVKRLSPRLINENRSNISIVVELKKHLLKFFFSIFLRLSPISVPIAHYWL